MPINAIRLGARAVAIGAALAAAGTAGVFATPAGATTAKATYTAALTAAGSQNVHFVSTASEQGTSIRVTGDTGSTSGTQSLVVRKGKVSETVTVMLVGTTGYLKGNSTALTNILGLTAAQSTTYAGQWLSFPTSNANLATLVDGLHDKDVATELKLTGPLSFGAAKTINGTSAIAIKGEVGTSTKTKVPAVLYVEASGTHRPIEELTNPAKSTSKTAIHGTVLLSHWGEATTETAPAGSTSLLTLATGAAG